MVLRTMQTDRLQIGYYVKTGTLIDAKTVRYDINVVEHFEYGGTWLMNGADNSTAASGQRSQYRYGLRTTTTIQTTGKINKLLLTRVF